MIKFLVHLSKLLHKTYLLNSVDSIFAAYSTIESNGWGLCVIAAITFRLPKTKAQ
jgi:hypothetical protein